MDKIDRKLLGLLQADDSLALAELARKTSSSLSTISDRIKRLVRIGVIKGFHARVAAEKVGLELLAFVVVAWSDPKVEADLIKIIERTSNVLECHRLAGEWNCFLKLRVRNIPELESFLAKTLASISGIERTNIMIALSSVKEVWAIPIK
ncbi:MAG: Lrp/AsnC family transcriptional regulator [Acidobacteria bacterium]|nr:Lrp/AsnC family transcriptional regulator [Acidobacteriota bacterium]